MVQTSFLLKRKKYCSIYLFIYLQGFRLTERDFSHIFIELLIKGNETKYIH